MISDPKKNSEAARAGHVETVQLLLLYGSDINVKTKSNQTPLDIAKKYLTPDHAMIQLLESWSLPQSTSKNVRGKRKNLSAPSNARRMEEEEEEEEEL